MYDNGNVYSPVDIVINPQRVANRIMSVMENIINNSGASGVLYDPDLVEDEDEFLRAIKEGRPAAIKTKGFGMTNVAGHYDQTPTQGVNNLANLANVFLGIIEKISGVTDVMKGQTNNKEQLVGVMQIMTQRGSVLQARFYDALESVYKECYQALATSGKRLYIENRKQLIDIAGEDGTEVLSLDPELKLENIRVNIVRSNNWQTEREQVDQMVLQIMQMQLLDQSTASALLGRANSDDMWQAVREFAKLKDEMAKQQQQQAQQEQQQLKQAQQEQQQKQDKDVADQRKFEDYQLDKNLENKVHLKLLDKAGR